MSSKIKVEVVYALPKKQYLIHLMLEAGTTAEEAVRASGLLNIFKDINLSKNKIGIYSRQIKLTDVIEDGDRIEIYRALIVDPKHLRRQRAKSR